MGSPVNTTTVDARRWRPVVVAAILVGALLGPRAAALEVDPYYAWGRSLADSSDVVNAKFDLEIRAAVERAESRGEPPSCAEVTRAVYRRLAFEIFQPIDLWATQSPMVARVPADGVETAEYRGTNLYSDAAWIDIGMWMPITPVINIDGVFIGIDKLSHFVSSGWRYRGAYLRALEDGLDAVAAEEHAIRWGILEERTINGSISTGVLSRGDLEANHGGMRFYLELCSGEDPMLVRDGERWVVARPFDIGGFVGPEWDEGYQPSVFSAPRWRRVQPRLKAYCPRLDDPAVRSMLRRYREIDRETATERVFQALVDEGRVKDPEQYGLFAACPGFDPEGLAAESDDPRPESQDEPQLAGDSLEELRQALRALDLDRPLRVVGLLAVGLDRPKGFSGSIGAIFAHPRRSDDCRDVCLLSGPYVQADLGTTGAQVSLGYGSIVGDTGSGRRFLHAAYLAVGIEAALLRTWGGSPLDPEAQTLAGVEGQLSVARVAFRLGVFRRLTEAENSDRWEVTAGLGWGF